MDLELTEKERELIFLKRGLCPACQSDLTENSYGEDGRIYEECSENPEHYSKYLGLWDDLNE
jgi:hypothetical protein